MVDLEVLEIELSQAGLAGCRVLKCDANGWRDGQISILTKVVKRNALNSLVSLNLRENAIGDAAMVEFSIDVPGHLNLLTTLNLSQNDIGGAGLRALSLALGQRAFPALAHLDLSKNRISDDGVEAFAKAVSRGAAPGLSHLHLDINQIEASGVIALAKAAEKGGCKALRELWLNGNMIHVDGLEALAEVLDDDEDDLHFPSLKTLHIMRGDSPDLNEACYDRGIVRK